MNRQKIIEHIEKLISDHWVYWDDSTHRKAVIEVINFLEDIGFDADKSVEEREKMRKDMKI